jgi:hypothetical protein
LSSWTLAARWPAGPGARTFAHLIGRAGKPATTDHRLVTTPPRPLALTQGECQ